MDETFRQKIQNYVHNNIGEFHRERLRNIQALRLKTLLQNKNPYLFRAKNLNSAPAFVSALLDARLSSSEEGSFGNFLEGLAIFTAMETGGGQKSSTRGIDIDLTRESTRYLIAVKSGKNWGNSSQHSELRLNFDNALRVLRQSRHTGAVQPTLGICYGKFKTAYKHNYLHVGGQNFWQLLSGEPTIVHGGYWSARF